MNITAPSELLLHHHIRIYCTIMIITAPHMNITAPFVGNYCTNLGILLHHSWILLHHLSKFTAPFMGLTAPPHRVNHHLGFKSGDFLHTSCSAFFERDCWEWSIGTWFEAYFVIGTRNFKVRTGKPRFRHKEIYVRSEIQKIDFEIYNMYNCHNVGII